MQKIAKEINYSETTFIQKNDKNKGSFDVRIFTPNEEVPFAGHPTLGTAYVIAKEIIDFETKKIILNLKIGKISVEFQDNDKENPVLWMKQISPIFGQIFKPENIYKVLSINSEDIDDRFPIQEVSTGLPFILVPLKNLESVKEAEISLEEYNNLIKNTKAKAIFIFSPQTYTDENDINARMFAPFYGILEDPATGSANGCLAGYLVKHKYFKSGKVNLRVEQGCEIGRPSILFLKAEEIEEEIEVKIGGKVFMVAKGELI